MEKDKNTADRQEPEKSQGLVNILKLIFLAAVLIVSWYLLSWLIGH